MPLEYGYDPFIVFEDEFESVETAEAPIPRFQVGDTFYDSEGHEFAVVCGVEQEWYSYDEFWYTSYALMWYRSREAIPEDIPAVNMRDEVLYGEDDLTSFDYIGFKGKIVSKLKDAKSKFAKWSESVT